MNIISFISKISKNKIGKYVQYVIKIPKKQIDLDQIHVLDSTSNLFRIEIKEVKKWELHKKIWSTV